MPKQKQATRQQRRVRVKIKSYNNVSIKTCLALENIFHRKHIYREIERQRTHRIMSGTFENCFKTAKVTNGKHVRRGAHGM